MQISDVISVYEGPMLDVGCSWPDYIVIYLPMVINVVFLCI
jgi:hypothetical protein